MEQPFRGVVVPTESIRPFEHPTIKEILKQQRMILEMQKELLKAMAQPVLVYHSKEESK